jgi:hypothetical protein
MRVRSIWYAVVSRVRWKTMGGINADSPSLFVRLRKGKQYSATSVFLAFVEEEISV